mmetsp:Transcript_49299/g.123945  ORF Transcript_49299/g.123945 Transcript_49299/m.123945 type:complete len:104 (-) Transcript_49299:553-864(-)
MFPNSDELEVTATSEDTFEAPAIIGSSLAHLQPLTFLCSTGAISSFTHHFLFFHRFDSPTFKRPPNVSGFPSNVSSPSTLSARLMCFPGPRFDLFLHRTRCYP